MKNTMSKALWGVFFVLLGISLAGRAVGVFDFNLYFPGWWTLFIIVPSAIRLVSSENRTASLFGLGIGILLLMSVQGIVDWYTFPRLIVALIFISIGCSVIFRKDRRRGQEDTYSNNTSYDQYSSSQMGNNNQDSNNSQGNSYSQNSNNSQDSSYSQNSNNSQDNSYNQSNNNSQDSRNHQSTSQNYSDNQTTGNNYDDLNGNQNYYNQSDNNNYKNNSSYQNSQGTYHGDYNHYTGFFSGRNIQFVDEEFTGADVTSILGNVQLDLRNAILKDDVVIETTCILGGVDVYVPRNARVVLNCTPILGGVENKVITPYNSSGNIHTIFIRGTCILGGIEVK